jgi:hypothetical protein
MASDWLTKPITSRPFLRHHDPMIRSHDDASIDYRHSVAAAVKTSPKKADRYSPSIAITSSRSDSMHASKRRNRAPLACTNNAVEMIDLSHP